MLAVTQPWGGWRTLPLPCGVTARVRTPARGPYVLVTQGYHLPQEFMDDAALWFWVQGFTPVTVDLNRVGDPAVAIRETLSSLDAPVFFYAHSGSVTPAARVAGEQPARVPAVVLLGFHPGLPRSAARPRNVLLCFGKFDDYISVEDMRRALLDTDEPRELFLSPYSQHGGEPFDPAILERGMRWIGGAPARPVLPVGLRHWGWFLLGWSLPLPAGLALGLPFPCAGLGALARHWRLGRRALFFCLAGMLCVWMSYFWSGPRGGSFAEWIVATAMYAGLYLPSQAHGRLAGLAIWQLALLWAVAVAVGSWRKRPG